MKSKTPLILSEVRALIKKHDRKDLEYIIAQMYKMIPKDKKTDKYYITEKINNYTELIFRCYANLYEFDNALNDFNKNMIEDSEEIKLYILIRLLMDYGEKDLILNLLVEGEKKMRLREGLIKMKNYIIQKNKLPDYMF